MLRRGYLARLSLGLTLASLGFALAFDGADKRIWLKFYAGMIIWGLGVAQLIYTEMRRITEGIPGAKNIPE